MELQIAQYQSLLQFQFTNMETVISRLKGTGDSLTNALSSFPKFNRTTSNADHGMATFESARNKYVSDSVTTMSPGQLIVALYDRILLDLERGDTRRSPRTTCTDRTARSCTRRRSWTSCSFRST